MPYEGAILLAVGAVCLTDRQRGTGSTLASLCQGL